MNEIPHPGFDKPEEYETFTTTNGLEEAAKKYATEWHENPDGSAWKPFFEVSAIKAFIAGAKWQEGQDLAEMAQSKSPLLVAYANRCFENGKQTQKEQDDKELSEKIASAYQLGLADKEKQTEKRWLEDRDGCFWDGVEEGKKAMKEQMMKEAVEGEVCGRVYDHINVRFADGICKFLEPKNISHIPADVSKYKVGDKVRIIICKKEDEK